MLYMIFPASLIALELDRLRRDTAASSSARIECTVVDFFSFLFSHMKCRPVESIATVAIRKGSSVSISSCKVFSAAKFLSYACTHVMRAFAAKLFLGNCRKGACMFPVLQCCTSTEGTMLESDGGCAPCWVVRCGAS